MLDLHNHTTASDGLLGPAALVARASARGIRGMAVTDHDTVAGVAEAVGEGRRLGVEVISGIELSTVRAGGKPLHVLGYLFDPACTEFLGSVDAVVQARVDRNHAILGRLATLGMPLTMDEVASFADGVVGRPHFARALVAKGYVRKVDRAFDRWLGDGRPAHVVSQTLDPDAAIAMLHAAGGVAVIAHPLTYEKDAGRLEALIAPLAKAGLDGLEVYYPEYTSGQVSMLRCFADRYKLIATGGSDFHVEPGPATQPAVPADTLERLRRRAARYA